LKEPIERNLMSMLKPKLSPEVAAAISAGRPVVALESTIITHGMPYPANLETALGVEAVVRDNGAVPATIAVIDGELRAGLERYELEKLAQAKGVVKASGRDLAVAMVRGQTAGTTVSATMLLADLAGIDIFATGGVGGVHRGAEQTPGSSRSWISPRRWNTWKPSACRSSLTGPKTSPPSLRGKAATRPITGWILQRRSPRPCTCTTSSAPEPGC
jgi:hypothetical protein